MYTKVRSEEQKRLFNSIWIRSWEEKGFELEFSKQADQYLIQSKREKQYVATMELRPFAGPDAEIETAFPFSNLPCIRDNLQRVYEVDKVSILREYRGLGTLNAILFTLVLYAMSNHVKYYVALIDLNLYEALEQRFDLPVQKLSDKVFYKGDDAIPMIIDMEYFIEHNYVKNLMQKPKKHGISILQVLAWWSLFKIFNLRYRLMSISQAK